MRRSTLAYASIVIVGLVAAAGAGAYWLQQYDSQKLRYISDQTDKTAVLAKGVETAFATIYQNIRTLSLLPSIRNFFAAARGHGNAVHVVEPAWMATARTAAGLEVPGTVLTLVGLSMPVLSPGQALVLVVTAVP